MTQTTRNVCRFSLGLLAVVVLTTTLGCNTGGGVVPAWSESRLEREVSEKVARDPFPSAAEAGLQTR